MRTALAHLKALLPRPDAPGLARSLTQGLAGPLPLAGGGMLSQEWLAPHLVRLPALVPAARRPQDG